MKFYIYIHRRPDTGGVFYVGRGKLYKRSTILPRRAHTKSKRNSIWNGIVARNEGLFTVEIIHWCETAEEVNQLERDTIKKYGKIIDGNGTLCNLTDGGEGCEGFVHSDDTKTRLKTAHSANPCRAELFKSDDFKSHRAKVLKDRGYVNTAMLGKHHTVEAKAKMSEARKGGKHYAAKEVVNVENGKIYDCVEDDAKDLNLNKWTLYKALSGERKNNTPMRYGDVL